MHIHPVRSEKYIPSCCTQVTEVTGLRPTAHWGTRIVYTERTLLFIPVFTLRSSIKAIPTKHTHTNSHTPSSAPKGHLINIPIHTVFKISCSSIATHQRCPGWHLAVCACVLLCGPICMGSEVVTRSGRGYR